MKYYALALALLILSIISIQTMEINQSRVNCPKFEMVNPSIYASNQIFVFKVEKRNGFVVETDTVILRSFNKPWAVDKAQLKACWLRSISDSASCRAGTGIVESDSMIWLHPIRDDEYAILEYSPFPQIKLPAQLGATWSEDFVTGGNKWGNNQWVKHDGLFSILYQYHITSGSMATYKGSAIPVFNIEATGTSSVSGKSKLKYSFSYGYGFVSLVYSNIDGSVFSFDLIDRIQL
ncbi:MAG: hypothetical protein WCR52_22780 [Bacteroidota bacterium]